MIREFSQAIVFDDTAVLHTGCGGQVIKKTVYNRKGQSIGEVYQCNKCHRVGELSDFTREKSNELALVI